MKTKNYFIFYFVAIFMLSKVALFAQCTEAKDSEMAKYMNLTKTQDAQGCSQCGMLALYFCSAKYCVAIEDKRKVGAMIAICKRNIQQMGQPYCCPEYLNKQPEWGSMAGGATGNSTSNSGSNNPLTNYNNSSTTTNDFEKGVERGQQISDIATGLVTLFTPTSDIPEQIKGRENYAPTNSLSAGYGNLLFERGKDAKVDLAVDLAVDLFQSKFGDGGTNSALIDIGGGILGGILGGLTQTDAQKAAQAEAEAIRSKQIAAIWDEAEKEQQKNEAKLTKFDNHMVYLSGITNVPANAKDHADLILHHKADTKLPNAFLLAPSNNDESINLLNEAINLYKQNPERASYLYLAYTSRGLCKMQKGAYEAAIIDYYYAQEILKNILNGQLPDNLEIDVFTQKDMVITTIHRAYAKYRLADYIGAIADCKLAMAVLDGKNIFASGKPNDCKDIVQAIIAMSQFGLESYEASYLTFFNANLTHNLNTIMPMENAIRAGGFYGFPIYFHFDIAQIKGLCYYKANKIDEAINIYQNLVDAAWLVTNVGGDISAVYSTLGSFYYTKGDKTKAISLLDKAIQINPSQLEYYYKRGTYKQELGQTAEANADFKIVKTPESLTFIKKDPSYYYTKCNKFSSEANHSEVYRTLKEAIIDYPDETGFFTVAVQHLLKSKSKLEAKELADLLIRQEKNHHFILSLQYEFSGNMQDAETEMKLAFNNGFGFFETKMLSFFPYFKLCERPYYFKLFVKYGTKANNNFIPLDFNRENMTRVVDSINADIIKNAQENVKKIYETSMPLSRAQSLGNFEEYLSLLNKVIGTTVTLTTPPNFLFDKIECLIILGKKKEAHDFAKKIVALLKKDTVHKTQYDLIPEGIAIQNFAKDSYEW